VVRRSFDRATLRPLREMPSEDVLALLATLLQGGPNLPADQGFAESPLARSDDGRGV